MTRRASLPGAAELFRTTGAAEPVAVNPAPAPHPGVGAVPAAREVPAASDDVEDMTPRAPRNTGAPRGTRSIRSTRRVNPVSDYSPTGRERHEEKITVYCSPEELLDLESARLHLRAEHGMAVDRGRIVREAVAVVLADLEAKGGVLDLGAEAARVVSLSAEDAVEIEAMLADSEPPASVLGDRAFRVTLDNFEGPFDLLLSLITRRQMDVTEVALSQVTDEFIAYLSASATWDLGQATEFLVVASTLLDLKAARLLPSAEVEDDEDLALLEARDLLFARLLQYRAYKLVAAYLGGLERAQALRHGRSVELDPEFAQLLPEVLIGISPERLAAIAAATLAPRPVPVVHTEHVHAPRVSVREHMAIIRERLRRSGSLTFRSLVAECGSTLEVVARFLGLLELYRDGVVAFDQAAALAELRVRWTGPTDDDADQIAEADAVSVDEEYG